MRQELCYRGNGIKDSTKDGNQHYGEPSEISGDLQEMDTALSATIKNGEIVYSLTRYRDVVKKYAKGMEFVIFAIENQQKIHYAMPVRKMLYDALGYVKQCKEIASGHVAKDYKNDDEFLSRFKKQINSFQILR